MASKQLNVGVIGTGVGRLHIEAYGKIPGVKMLAVCDLNEAELKEQADKFNVPLRFDDYRKLLAVEELDAVSIAVPNYLHKPIAIEALARGLHVLCEKPMSTDPVNAEAMVKAAEKADRRLMINMTMRFAESFSPLAQFAASGARRGALGETYFASGAFIKRRGLPATNARKAAIMGRGMAFVTKAQAGGGAIMDLGVHIFDMLWWAMGCPRPRLAVGSTFLKLAPPVFAREGKKIDVDEMAVGQVVCDGGKTIQFTAAWIANMKSAFSINVYGTKGGLTGFPLILHTEKRGEQVDEEIKLLRASPSSQQHFIACIRNPRKKMMASAAECLWEAKALSAVQKSAETGRAVAIP